MEGYDKYENYASAEGTNNAASFENYDVADMSPYQMLNQMKSWSKAIYLYVDDIDGQTKASLTVMNDRITSEVANLNTNVRSYIDQRADAITQTVTNLSNNTAAQFQVQAGQISSKVAQSDYNGNTIASLINQTATTIQIAASKINLTGFVTVSDLGVNGTTTIHGNRIQTGTLTANQIQAYSITGDRLQFNTIGANQIAAGAISSGHISAGAVTANAIESYAISSYHIQAGAISAGHIQSYSITADLIASGAIQAYHIAAGAITADMISTGYLSASRISGGTLSGVDINVSNTVGIGNALYFNGRGSDYFIEVSGGNLELNSWGDVTINGKRILTTDDL